MSTVAVICPVAVVMVALLRVIASCAESHMISVIVNPIGVCVVSLLNTSAISAYSFVLTVAQVFPLADADCWSFTICAGGTASCILTIVQFPLAEAMSFSFYISAVRANF